MSSTYQSLIVLLIASMVVVAMWYADREVKTLHANIKIIQNMLKIVLSNQNQTPILTQPFNPEKEHSIPENEHPIPENEHPIPGQLEQPVLQRVNTLEIIHEETKGDEYVPFADEINESDVNSDDEESAKDTDQLEVEPVLEVKNTPSVEPLPEPITEPVIEPPKKKRTYNRKKAAEITV